MYKDFPHKPGVYRIWIGDKSYIGASHDLRGRMIKHFSYLKHNCHHNKYLQRSYNLHKDDIRCEVLFSFNDDPHQIELNDQETYFHMMYDSVRKGFNNDYPRMITNKFTLTDEQIEKAVAKSSKIVLAFDRYSGELKKRYRSISEANRSLNPNYKRGGGNISAVCRGKLNHSYNHTFCFEIDYDKNKDYSFPHDHKKGKAHSNEHIAKLRANNANSKSVFKYDEDLNFIGKYISRSECERQHGFRNEFLRKRVDKDILIDGYYYKHNEL